MTWRAATHNLVWKIGALAVAILLWFSIVGEPEVVTTRTVPIFYKNLSPDLLIGSQSIDGVRVDFRGPSSKLTANNLSDASVQLDLAHVTGPGERTFTLSDSDVRVPEGVSFQRAVPSQLRIQFARMMERDVPVTIRVTGEPPAGYRLVRKEVAPMTQRIAGPEARVLAIENAGTDAIDLSGFKQNTEVRVNTFVVDPEVRLASSPIVTVRLTIEKTGKTK
jgi:YbbR domain-containing protein